MVLHLSNDIKIGEKQLDKISGNPEATAKAVKLVYVNDSMEGFKRIRNGKSFRYLYKSKPLKDKTELQRIRKLVIPPAWEDVWICKLENGHLQATGLDARKKKTISLSSFMESTTQSNQILPDASIWACSSCYPQTGSKRLIPVRFQ
jgi:DNA topoisomerase IB